MSVKQSKNKTWYARVSYKDGEKYRTKSKYGLNTKKEAVMWEQKFQTQLNAGVDLGSNPIFLDYFWNWFQVYKEDKVRKSTYVTYRATYNKIMKYFSNKKIKDINRQMYQEFLNFYAQTLSKTSVQKINKHVRSCVHYAIEDGLLHKDFTFKADIHGQEGIAEASKYLSEIEVKKLLISLTYNITNKMTTRYMAIIAISTGMRFGEICGLTYDCVNFKDNTITINKTWDYKENTGFLPTKTKGSLRTIKLESSVMEILRNYILERKKLELASNFDTNPNKLVFANFDGFPPSNTAANKSLRRACDRAEISKVTFHHLRHTHVSLLLYNKMDIPSIAKRVGHASPTTTMEVYVHIIQELENLNEQISDRAVENLFK